MLTCFERKQTSTSSRKFWFIYACCVGDGAGQKCQARVQACALDHLRPIRVVSTRRMFPPPTTSTNKGEKYYPKQVDEQNDIANNIVCIFR
jgi:hypothetical protein